MPALFSYLLKLSCSLAVVYIFYMLVLRRLTFYTANRWYLLGYSLLCFIIPFLDISRLMEAHQLARSNIVQAIPVLQNYTAAGVISHQNHVASFTVWDYGLLVLALGMLVLLARLLVQYLSFRRLRNSAQLIAHDVIKLYQVAGNVTPFSFGHSIFINQQLHNESELQEIIRHEFVHVAQRHTIDIICTEILCILNWYNPFAWGLRRAVRQNLEFIADDIVVQSGVNKKEYQYLLLKVLGTSQFSIAAPFNFSTLKKRIVMMNKLKSAKAHAVKFLFILPLIAVLLVAFRSEQVRKKENGFMLQAIVDTPPVQPAPPVVSLPAEPEALFDDYKAFLKRNPPVKALAWTETSVFVHFKKGGYTEFRLTDPNDMNKFEKHYGSLPQTPAHISTLIAQEKRMNKFIVRNPDVASVFWQTDRGNQQPNRIGIYFKDGSSPSAKSTKGEIYRLDDKEDMRRFEKKFGPLPLSPIVPPPPTVAPPPPPPIADTSSTTSGAENRYTQQLEFLQDRIAQLNDSLRNGANSKNIKALRAFLNERTIALQKEQNALQLHLQHKQDYLQEKQTALHDYKKALQQRQKAIEQDQKASQEYLQKAQEELQLKQKALQEASDHRSSFAPSLPQSNEVILTADTILFNAGKRVFTFSGTMKTDGKNAALHGKGDIPITAQSLVLMNGKEVALDRSFANYKSATYKLTTLNKQAAEKKYGDKGKNGAVEIETL